MRTLLLFYCTCLCACAKNTEVVVGLATDIRTPDSIDAVEMYILDEGGHELQHQSWSLLSTHLPASISVVDRGAASTKFTVVVEGTHLVGHRSDGTPLSDTRVTRRAQLGFVDGKRLFVRLALTSDCMGTDKLCPSGETCVNGVCQASAIDPASLPVWSPQIETTAQCGSNAAALSLSAPSMVECPAGLFCQDAECIIGVQPPMPDLAAMPDLALPDLALPDLALPDLALPDLALPDLALPDLALPDLAVPDLALPDFVVPPDLVVPDDLTVAPPDLVTPDLTPRNCTWTTTNIAGFLGGVWGSSASDVYITTSSKLLHSSDGTNFAPNTNVGAGPYWTVWGSGASDVYVGLSGGVTHSSDGGMSWKSTVLTSDPAFSVNAIWGSPSGKDVFASGAGSTGGALFHSADSGASWKKVPTGTNVTLNGWTSAAGDLYLGGGAFGFAPDDVYVAGAGMPAATALYSKDAGTHFQVISLTGLAHWDGFSFSTSSLQIDQMSSVVAVWGVAPNEIYVVLKKGFFLQSTGTVWRSTNQGDTFTNDFSSTAGVNAIWGTDACNVYAVGGGQSGSGYVAHRH